MMETVVSDEELLARNQLLLHSAPDRACGCVLCTAARRLIVKERRAFLSDARTDELAGQQAASAWARYQGYRRNAIPPQSALEAVVHMAVVDALRGQHAKDVISPVSPATYTTRLYRCDRCHHETNVNAETHRPMLCSRTNCGGTTSVADAFWDCVCGHHKNEHAEFKRKCDKCECERYVRNGSEALPPVSEASPAKETQCEGCDRGWPKFPSVGSGRVWHCDPSSTAAIQCSRETAPIPEADASPVKDSLPVAVHEDEPVKERPACRCGGGFEAHCPVHDVEDLRDGQ